MVAASSGLPDERVGGLAWRRSSAPPTPVSAMPGPGDPAADQLERDRDAGRREVADPALQLEVAAGRACPAAAGIDRLDRDLVVGEGVLERPGHELARPGSCAARPGPARRRGRRARSRPPPSRPAGRRGTASRPACRGCARSGRRSAAPRRPSWAALPGSSVERSRSAWRHSAPMRSVPSASTRWWSRPGRLLMSTSSSGAAKRSFSSGTRLWPPASTLASPPPSLEQRDRLVERARRLVAEPGRVHVRASRRAGPAPVGLASGVGARAQRSPSRVGDRDRPDSISVGSGRGSWCGGHGPCTGWPATLRYSTSCGNAQTVGLLPVLGAFSISSYMRGLPALAPPDSSAT